MIAYFPPPYPDETLESRCARFAVMQGYVHGRHAIQDLFGKRRMVISPDLPVDLTHLLSVLPPGHTCTLEQLLITATLLPYYAPFLSPRQLTNVKKSMAGSNGAAIHSGGGLMASLISPPAFLRLCPACVQADRAAYGECYWHRVHQTPGTLLCPHHDAALRETPVSYYNRATRYKVTSAEAVWPLIADAVPTVKMANLDQYQTTLAHIATESYWLLHQREFSLFGHAQERYLRVLAELGLATFTGQIRAKKLTAEFIEFYSPNLLDLVGANIDQASSDTWLLRLLRRPTRFHHPLLHILLTQFLGHSLATITSIEPHPQPFGAGPWPCLNTVCHLYRQMTIQHVEIQFSRDSRRPVAVFACPVCQLSYSRVGPDRQPDDMWRIGRYTTFGPTWEAAMAQQWGNPAISLRQLAQKLGVDPRTVKRQAARLGLLFPRPHDRGSQKFTLRSQKDPKSQGHPSILEAQRRQWLALIEDYPQEGVAALRRRLPAVPAWLWRHDRPWLKAHSPAKRSPSLHPGLVDWRLRDLEVAVHAARRFLDLLIHETKPRHLTRTAIRRAVSYSAALEKHAAKLPLASGLITRLSETREQFALRRIRWQAWRLNRQGRTCAHWQLVRTAGLGRMADWSAVKGYLTQTLDWLEQPVYKPLTIPHSVLDALRMEVKNHVSLLSAITTRRTGPVQPVS
jgi:hypothetical protein